MNTKDYTSNYELNKKTPLKMANYANKYSSSIKKTRHTDFTNKENMANQKSKIRKKRKKSKNNQLNSSGNSIRFSDLPKSDHNDISDKEREISKSIEKKIISKNMNRQGFNLTFKESVFAKTDLGVKPEKRKSRKSKDFTYDPTIKGNKEYKKHRKEDMHREEKKEKKELGLEKKHVKKKLRLIKAKSGNDYDRLKKMEEKQKQMDALKKKMKSMGNHSKIKLWDKKEDNKIIISDTILRAKGDNKESKEKEKLKISDKKKIVSKTSILKNVSIKEVVSREKNKLVKDEKYMAKKERYKKKLLEKKEKEKAKLREKYNKKMSININKEHKVNKEKKEEEVKIERRKEKKVEKDTKSLTKEELKKKNTLKRYKKKFENNKLVLNKDKFLEEKIETKEAKVESNNTKSKQVTFRESQNEVSKSQIKYNPPFIEKINISKLYKQKTDNMIKAKKHQLSQSPSKKNSSSTSSSSSSSDSENSSNKDQASAKSNNLLRVNNMRTLKNLSQESEDSSRSEQSDDDAELSYRNKVYKLKDVNLSNKEILVTSPPPRNKYYQMTIVRNKSGFLNSFNPIYHMYFSENMNIHVLSAKKKSKGKRSQYIFSMKKKEFNQKNENVLANLFSNVWGTKFKLFSKGRWDNSKGFIMRIDSTKRARSRGKSSETRNCSYIMIRTSWGGMDPGK